MVTNLFTELGHWLTTKITEEIGPKPAVFLGTCVWRTLTGYLEELGAEWRADRGRNITSPGVDLKGTIEEELGAAGHSKFRRVVGKVLFICWRVPRTQSRSLRDWLKCLHNTRSWSFRLDPEPKSQQTLDGLERHRLGRMQGDTAEH